MRELKYRVYDPNLKKLVYFDLHNIMTDQKFIVYGFLLIISYHHQLNKEQKLL